MIFLSIQQVMGLGSVYFFNYLLFNNFLIYRDKDLFGDSYQKLRD